ncbi:hypothetical protein CEXT_548781 [Caerostris extrusa]|uniref:LIM zinc-binding domain-containing protein n=1 Tax=Caerostris extrusa TaxID=172846 RepID=A0AAV4XL82_CAEEX|nr:hypothetical protein CEXT_548781 [Caerostris extrusa]
MALIDHCRRPHGQLASVLTFGTTGSSVISTVLKRESGKTCYTISQIIIFIWGGEHFEIVSFAICHQNRLVVRGASSEQKIHARRRPRLLLKKTSAATLVPYQKVPSREHPSPIPSYVHQMVSSNAGHFGVDRTGTLPVISPGGFHTPPPPSNCAGCGFRISDRFYLYVADRQWHSNCLKCHGCKATLDQEMSCFFRDGHSKRRLLQRQVDTVCLFTLGFVCVAYRTDVELVH